MWTIILLVGLNIIVILIILYVVGCSDSSPKFQIPNNEHLNNPTGLADVESPKISPWEYYSSLKHKSWNELSEYEKG